MTINITISAADTGLDTRLFFPLLAGGEIYDVSAGTGGLVSYTLNGDFYEVSYTGQNFGFNAHLDFHGEPVSASLLVSHNSVEDFQTLGTMTFSSDDATPPYLDTGTWLTPDSLYSMNATHNRSVHLSFVGGAAADKLFGSSFDDSFDGADGNDRMTGGAGRDEFIFDAVGPTNADHITDFQVGVDRILIDHSDNTALFKGVTSANLQKTFHDITVEAEQKDDRIIYNHKTGALSYDSDGSGHNAAVIFAYIDHHAAPDWRDIAVF
jgi:Ca2+-binding RTX toxin-like protein